MQEPSRCGFVAVLGAPNAGKSTLLNALVGTKVSIVSPKVQTTRANVRGIALYEHAQIILIDTPGIFNPSKSLERAMVSAAWQGGAEADMVMFVVDASKSVSDPKTTKLIKRLGEEANGRPAILVLNKVDKIAKEKLLQMSIALNDLYDFDATFMISALKEKGTDDILRWLSTRLPESPWHYPEDQVSDMPMRLMAAEITREKLFNKLYQELPYGLMVETEDWEDFDNGSIKISQLITIARDQHKGIVLGKGGQQVKQIGEMARKELEEILETRVHLKLFVRVQENWADDPEKYEIIGLDYQG
jgi:GTP-binding protein Era